MLEVIALTTALACMVPLADAGWLADVTAVDRPSDFRDDSACTSKADAWKSNPYSSISCKKFHRARAITPAQVNGC